MGIVDAVGVRVGGGIVAVLGCVGSGLARIVAVQIVGGPLLGAAQPVAIGIDPAGIAAVAVLVDPFFRDLSVADVVRARVDLARGVVAIGGVGDRAQGRHATTNRGAPHRAVSVSILIGVEVDLDAFIDQGNAILNMTRHRAESHSLLYVTLAAPLLAWGVSRAVARRCRQCMIPS